MYSTSPYHIYIHAPWCKSKCPYCDFTVYINRSPPFEEWRNKLLLDHQYTSNAVPWSTNGPKTIYFGGGTPSLVPIPYLASIIERMRTSETAEITIEVNPGDVTPKILQEFKGIGITRLSLGIQSFNRTHLRRLGRGTTPKDCHQLLQWVEQADFASWSMDLMFGLPNQTLQELNDDIEQLLLVTPPHVSLYGLTYKEGTPLHQAIQKGQLSPIEEAIWVEQFQTITDRLTEAGYQRYEVSNFCRPPHQAQHNEGIWKNEVYMGLGPSAHGFWPTGVRTQYSSSWKEWLQSPRPSMDECSQEQRALDFLITAIRHVDGISLSRLSDLGYTLTIPRGLRNHDVLANSIVQTATHIKLSQQGWIIVDWITDVLADALQPIT